MFPRVTIITFTCQTFQTAGTAQMSQAVEAEEEVLGATTTADLARHRQQTRRLRRSQRGSRQRARKVIQRVLRSTSWLMSCSLSLHLHAVSPNSQNIPVTYPGHILKSLTFPPLSEGLEEVNLPVMPSCLLLLRHFLPESILYSVRLRLLPQPEIMPQHRCCNKITS